MIFYSPRSCWDKIFDHIYNVALKCGLKSKILRFMKKCLISLILFYQNNLSKSYQTLFITSFRCFCRRTLCYEIAYPWIKIFGLTCSSSCVFLAPYWKEIRIRKSHRNISSHFWTCSYDWSFSGLSGMFPYRHHILLNLPTFLLDPRGSSLPCVNIFRCLNCLVAIHADLSSVV